MDGAELLQAAEAAGQGSDDDDFHMSSPDSSDLNNDSDSGELAAAHRYGQGRQAARMWLGTGYIVVQAV